MEEEKQYHLIDDYLNGELQGIALDEFKIQLNQSVELQQQVYLQSAIIKEINAQREAEIKAILTKEKHSTFKTVSIRSNSKIAMSIAASVVFLVVTYFYLSPKNASISSTLVSKKTPKEVNKPFKSKNKRQKDTPLEQPLIAEHELSDIDTELSFEDDSDFELSEDTELSSMEARTTRDNTLEKDYESEEFIIERDELIGSRFFLLQTVDYTTNNAYKDIEAQDRPSNVTSSKAATKLENKLEDATVFKKEKQTAAQVDLDVPPANKISVEYWKSVVNFKGYIFDGNTVQLYGISQNKALIFKELDNRIYVKIDGKHYFIEKNQTYKRFSEVSNPTLLNILND
jgi:hypothetical protein